MRLVGAAVLALALCGCGAEPRDSGTAAGRVMDALARDRFTTGRLSHQDAWHACPAHVDTAALVPRSACGRPPRPRTPGFERVAELERTAREQLAGDSSAAALQARALVRLRWHEADSAFLGHAIDTLERAHARAPDDARILNDLAVAYLALGERRQHLTPMLRALDRVERAVAIDSLLLPALFNRALVHERLYLLDGAARAWWRYLAVERDSAWRAEAHAHARAVASRAAGPVSWDSLLETPPARIDAAARARIAAMAAASAERARDAGMRALAGWGRAYLADDTARAQRLLALGREIARAAERAGHDRGMPRALGVVDAAAADPPRLRALARGHAALADGQRAYEARQYGPALRALAEAERTLRGHGSPAAEWAAYYRAASHVSRVEYAPGDSIYRALLARVDAGQPLLLGRAASSLGVSQLRQGGLDRANALYRQAAAHLEAAGDAWNAGSLTVNLSEGLTLAGDPAAGRAQAYRALRLLSPFRDSDRLNNHLANVAHHARADTLRHAALAVTREHVEMARRVGNAEVLSMAGAAHARELAAVGLHDQARTAMDRARAWSARLDTGSAGRRVLAHVRLVLSQALRPHDPRAALPLAASAVELYRGFGHDVYLPAALYEAAMAAWATGDRARAEAWLREAIREVERQRGSFRGFVEGATFYETVENVFDAMVALELQAGRADAAFAVLERGRVHGWSAEARAASSASGRAVTAPGQVAAALPDDMLFVEYALLRDSVVAWTVSRRGTRHHAVPVPRDTVAALAAALEQGREDAPVRLYDLLLRPLEAELRGMRQLTVVTERELSRVPFAALRDGAAGRHVVERYVLRTVPSASFFLAASAAPRRAVDGARALVVGDPELDSAAARALPRLAHAAREAGSVAALHPGATLLRGSQARRTAVLGLLPRAGIFHFAGHAVFNGDRPEQSYLALAPDAEMASGVLYAREIGGLRLSNVGVAVLSACTSLSPRATRTGAIPGLAYSFLRAGVPATVSTVWEVADDDATALLVAFHRHLAGGAPTAASLRAAQLAALREGADPRAWAGFIYTGP
ncbi:MAG TPA: CHAT domain-containing protein [Longimicrobium sp.]|nr:CHAT domain-containing protein [Longimicrobium sp.]